MNKGDSALTAVAETCYKKPTKLEAGNGRLKHSHRKVKTRQNLGLHPLQGSKTCCNSMISRLPMLHTENPYFITHKEFAALIGKSHRTIENILSSRRVADNGRKAQLPPFKKLSGKYVLSTKDFEKWLDEQPALTEPVRPTRGRPRNLQPSTKF